MPAALENSGWQARLELAFSAREGRTQMQRRSQLGPLVVQKPFYPESEQVCHVYLLHPPGGVVGGDCLELDVELSKDAWALLTTPAAGKFYRSAGATASLGQHFRVQAGATLEWLPQESIVFDGARADSLTRIDLHEQGRFLGWEMLVLGRPATGERFTRGALRQNFECWRDGQPLWLERNRYQGASPALDSCWGLQGYPLMATLVCVGADDSLVGRLRDELGGADGERLSVSLLNRVLVCRYLGYEAERARHILTRAWRLLRTAQFGREAHEPRIWRT